MKITFPEDLPVSRQRDEIAAAMRRHPVTIVCGDTGSGKTTQLPKIALQLRRGRDGRRIGCTQPRRLAATSVAQRVAEELGVELGADVGYQIRFQDRTCPATAVKFMTDGILLAETRRDARLKQYDTIIVDEAHERSLNIDFILGYLKRTLEVRDDLKVVISSATLDAESFADFFGGAPVVSVSGRTFPVEDEFQPPHSERERLSEQVLRAVEWLGEIDRFGDTLVFLPGEREIREAADLLQGKQDPSTVVLPLFARLAAKDQQAVFQPRKTQRRVILATNVAETSLTIPDIRSVVDSGTARVNRYDPRAGVQRLQVEPISKASARQRRGRCGRVSEGICVRLYDEEDYENRPDYTDPEIRRCNLAGVVLQMEHLGLGDPLEFPFVDPPQPKRVAQAYRTLEEIGAMAKRKGLTETGHTLARLPLDPRVGRLLVEAKRQDCLREALVVASALTVQDPRERPREKQEAADQAHARYADAQSDFTGWLRWWTALDAEARKSGNALRRFCRNNFLNYRRAQEWRNLHRELRQVLRELKWKLPDAKQPWTDPGGSFSEPLHRAILAAIPSHIGFKEPGKPGYHGAGGRTFFVHPGSGTHGKGLRWAMAFELVETAKLYARNVARIDPAWFEQAAPHLCRYRYSDPSWDPAQGAVYAKESVLGYGLVLVEGRRVHYGRVAPDKAREIFIREALVNGNTRSPLPAMAKNRELVDWVRGLERKLRRRDGLLFPHGMFECFDERLPADSFTQRAFERWAARNPRRVDLEPEDLMVPLLEPLDEADYPDALWIPDSEDAVELHYHHNPADEEDGITMIVPLAELPRLPDWFGDWLVPGWREEKVTAMVRALDKHVRQRLPPVADVVEQFLSEWEGYEPHCFLREALLDFFRTEYDQGVAPDSFELDRLPRHLQMRYEVVGETGESLAASRSLPALRERLAEVIEERFARAATAAFPERRTRSWDWGEVPRTVIIEGGLHGFPALQDEGETVRSRVCPTEACAEERHRWGVARLWILGHAKAVKRLRNSLFEPRPAAAGEAVAAGRSGEASELNSLAAAFGDASVVNAGSGARRKPRPPAAWGREEVLALDHTGDLPRENREELVLTVVEGAVRSVAGEPVRTREGFEALSEAVAAELIAAREPVLVELRSILRRAQDIRELMESAGPAYAENLEDAREQYRDLFGAGWMRWASTVGWKTYGVAVEGLEVRLRRLVAAPPVKDLAKIERFWEGAREVELCACGAWHPVPDAVRWWREENRRRLVEFAPELRSRWGAKSA